MNIQSKPPGKEMVPLITCTAPTVLAKPSLNDLKYVEFFKLPKLPLMLAPIMLNPGVTF